MTWDKANYDQSVSYHLPTMELKRKSILGYLAILQESEGMPGAHSMSYHGYFRTELLENEIALTMGWVVELESRLHNGPRIGIDYTQFHKVRMTIQNMEKKGHIKLSKSGRGFRILDTWRD